MRAIGLMILLLVVAPAALAQAQFRAAGAALVSEQETNKVIEVNERVRVSLALKNVGSQPVSNLIATIQAGDGVSAPFPNARDYGSFGPCGSPSVAREFEFTANAPAKSLLYVNLDLAADGRSAGLVSFRFRMGPGTFSFTNADSITINDTNKATPYPSIISVSNAPGSITKVSVTLSNLTHPYPDDLDILLVSPGGDAVMLMSDACGGRPGVTDATITFTDEALDYIPENSPPLLPRYRPANYDVFDSFPLPAPTGPYASVMSAFNGKSAIGDWQLFIVDDGRLDFGVLNKGWSLTISTLQAMDNPPLLTFLGRTTNSIPTIQFLVTGRPGYSYGIETAPDPIQSLPLETFLMGPTGKRAFEFPIESENRFFRAVTEP